MASPIQARCYHQSFQQTSISLCPTGKDDHKLHVRELPNLTVGPWELELESDEEVEYYDEAEVEPATHVKISGLFLLLSYFNACTRLNLHGPLYLSERVALLR